MVPQTFADKFYQQLINSLPGPKEAAWGFWDAVQGFFHAISWSEEYWLLCLLALHVVLLASIIYWQKVCESTFHDFIEK